MAKSKPKHKSPLITQNERANRAILGLDRPKPFDQLSVAEQIQVFRNEIIQLRKRISQQSSSHHKLLSRFRTHNHNKKGQVYLVLKDIEYNDYDTEKSDVVSDFDTLR